MKPQFIEEMREISGFGGSYEDACRKMVIAGVNWIDSHKDADLKFKQYKNIYGIISEETPEAKELIDIMCKASGDEYGVTRAMVQASVNHVIWIKSHSWEEYVQEMIKGKVV